jgi:surfactin family lipopeptide synthetase A
LISVLAVFKAGGAYVSLDYEYPQARIDFMLNDLDARFLITTSQLAAERNFGGLDDKKHVIMLDHFDFSVEAPSVDFSSSQSLAYIIYTSGTTGNPKGVMIEHHSLCSMLEWLIPMEELKAGDKCAAHPSFSFDASLPDLFGPLICGAQVHIIPSALRYDIGAFSRYLADNMITGLTMSTQIGMELLENHDLTLRYLFLGGENLHVNRKTAVKVINGYGPTEFTVCSSYHVVDQNRSYESIPIGHPVPGSRSLIVGPEGRLVPWGAMGELCLMGHQLARGYWQREQQTREKFIDCPFLPGERMYRTGDLVQWSQDGELLFHGRIDNQVKINGYRIELGEIESCMNAFPGIQTSAVVLSKQSNLQFLCGFYASDSTVTPEMLRKSLSESLPSYMVPMKLIPLERMPMTPNGKIDRRQLAEQASELPIGTGAVELPVSRREQVLLDLSKQLLGIDSIGVTDDLTMMGLSSLDAIKLSSLAEKEGIDLKVNDVLRLKTIRKIANHKAIMGEWVNGFDVAKPVVVIIQGLTFYHQLQPLISALCPHYSVFVVEPLQEHSHKTLAGKTKADILTAYTELIKQNLPADAQVSAFIGHSYGGEFSYRCAVKWKSETGQSPTIIMFDTYYDILKVVEKMQKMQDVIIPVEDGTPMLSYSGKVEYFEATQMSDKNLQEESMQAWHTLLPHMSVHPVSTSHFKLLDKENVNYCLSQINI